MSTTTSRRKVQIALPSMGAAEWEAVREPLISGWLTQGPKVAEFEQEFAKLHQVEWALATTSCTTALHLALAALEIGPGDEVLVPAFTWIATANVVLYCGATPVLVDVDPVTFNLRPESVREALTERTRAVIAVHLFGLCADVDAIKAVVPESVSIVEDAACAAGAEYKGRRAGGLGRVGCFSFHPRKSITTGEGGMLTTSDQSLAETATMLRNHGASVPEEVRHSGPQPYLLADFNLLGFNYRMTDIQAAVGIVQLAKLECFVSERSRMAARYREELRDISWLRLPVEPENGRHAWQSFVTFVDGNLSPGSRNEIMKELHEAGVATRPGTHAVHTLGYYRARFGFDAEQFPGALHSEMNSMAIPLHNRMDDADLDYVVDCIRGLNH